jgi:hypothetical protein
MRCAWWSTVCPIRTLLSCTNALQYWTRWPVGNNEADPLGVTGFESVPLLGACLQLPGEPACRGEAGPQLGWERAGDAVQRGPCLGRCCHFGQQQV